jgi:eukaryotic-like serine/threonine-protein kinase
MESGRWEIIQRLFFEALQYPEEQWEEFVLNCVPEDPELSVLVLAMLQTEAADEENFLVDRGLAGIAVTTVRVDGANYSTVSFGPYDLQQVLGEGGMGVVYQARHRDTGKTVAIKILLDSRLSPARRERFAGEQRMLAKLCHPHVAELYHSDFLPDGTPWFAMELVGSRPTDRDSRTNAMPIDEWCRVHGTPLIERLRLFATLCETVQYVHSHLVVHRDLKPSNILVTGEGSLKLIDFGIGKVQEDEPADAGRTMAGLRLLSIAYAAPEQIRGSAALPSTDIYALGVILYEILAGKHPFDLSECSTAEAQRRVLEREPERPSAVARRLGNPLGAGASQWRDLDAICLRAMYKERQHRYTTAQELLEDVDNFLSSHPLKARPDGAFYKVSKFAIRQRRPIAVAACALVTVTGAAIYHTVQLTRARDAALADAARTERMEHFLIDLMTNGDSEVGPAEDMRIRDLMGYGVKEAYAFKSDPAIQADIFQSLGDIYSSWGKSDTSFQLLSAALEQRQALFGVESAKAAESLVHLGNWYSDQDQLPEAEKLIRQALAIQKLRLPPADPVIARTYSALGAVLQRLNRQPEAIEDLQAAIRIQSSSPALKSDLSASITLLANSKFYLGHYDAAVALNRQALEIDQQLHGDHHPDVADDLTNLAEIETKHENWPGAENYLRQALEITRSWYGEESPNTADVSVHLADVLARENRLDEAGGMLHHALETQQKAANGKPRMRTAFVLNAMGVLASERKMWQEAESDYRQAAQIYTALYGDNHPETAVAYANLASTFLDEGKFAEAERQFRDVLVRYGSTEGVDPLNVGIARIKLGRTLERERRYKDAEGELLAGSLLVSGQTGESSSWLRAARADLVRVYKALQEPDKAAQYQAELSAQDRPGTHH